MYHISDKNKVNRKEFLSNVAEFIHLDLKIDARESLLNSLKYTLNALPILTYGVEVWAAFERFDVDTWDKCPIEQVHVNFCKHLFGVNRSIMNCRAELGHRTIKLITDLEVINFHFFN